MHQDDKLKLHVLQGVEKAESALGKSREVLHDRTEQSEDLHDLQTVLRNMQERGDSINGVDPAAALSDISARIRPADKAKAKARQDVSKAESGLDMAEALKDFVMNPTPAVVIQTQTPTQTGSGLTSLLAGLNPFSRNNP